MKVYGSSGLTASRRRSSTSRSPPRPRARSSSSAIASPVSPSWSITITCSRCGSRSRTSAILATCSAFSQKMAHASESPATHSHSSGELVG